MYADLFSRLEYVDYLIHSKSTGNPKMFSEKLNISERTLYDVIRLMKELGAPIEYSKRRQTYYYAEEGCFILRFQRSKQLGLIYARRLSEVLILSLCMFDCFCDSGMALNFL